MNVVFFGNTKHSLIGAKIIHDKLGLSFIVTIPQSPVEKFAIENKIPFLSTAKLDEEVIGKLAAQNPDFLLVEDYGLILPDQLLKTPKYACLNIHHSLLPKYRGPSPAPYAVLAGEKNSGVSIIKVTDKVDAGDIYAQKEYVLKPDETTDSLLNELNLLGGELAILVIEDILKGKATPLKQDEAKATYTHFLKKLDGFIELENPPTKEKIERMIRAFYPWPGVWSKLMINDKLLVIKFLPNKLVQVEGGKPMGYKDFLNGYPNVDLKLLTLLR
jgi:methionyl-tRNA formyltransferase